MISLTARSGFTTIELLVVIAIIGILSAAATPLYVGWRADSRNAEAARVVETAIARARSTAKNAGGPVTMTFVNDSATFSNGSTDVPLPYDSTLAIVDGPISLTFAPPFGQQEPFELSEVSVVTGTGRFERTATISVIPPLGKTAVVR